MIQNAPLPKEGCARCFWWRRRGTSPWGRCRAHDEKRWYQCMPCVEYERDPSRMDNYITITVGAEGAYIDAGKEEQP